MKINDIKQLESIRDQLYDISASGKDTENDHVSADDCLVRAIELLAKCNPGIKDILDQIVDSYQDIGKYYS